MTASASLRRILPAGFTPKIGVVLGSGLGKWADGLEDAVSVGYEDVPGLPRSTVPGHRGRFVFGRHRGASIAAAQGRAHLYEGHDAAAVTAQVRALAELGVSRILLTNAAGSLNPTLAPGGWMALRDHLNLTGTSPFRGGANFHDMSEVYDAGLRERLRAAGAAAGVAVGEGVYAGVAGPQYETPAEVVMLQILGADAVGMSTVLEAMQAKALGLAVAALSCLTNWAAGIQPGTLDHRDVLETGKAAADDFARLLDALIPSLDD